MERVFKYKLAKPYSECDLEAEKAIGFTIKDSELFDLIYKSEFGYEQQMCVGKNIFRKA